jgi:transposase
LYFFDPCHCIHNNINGYEWQIKGKTGTKQIHSNTGRKRINVIGGLHAITLKPYVILTEANCDTDVIILYMKELRKHHRDTKRPIVIILDNAKYNHNDAVKEEAKALDIQLEFLPAYCPHLNLIERLWKFLKKKVQTNEYYKEYQEFEEAIYNFFRNIQEYESELASLLTLNFEVIKAR